MKSIWRQLAIPAVAAALALDVEQAAAKPDFSIPLVISLSGGGAFLGQAEHRTLELAMPLINRDGGIHGRNVTFVFHDDQTSPQISVQLTSQIIAQSPPVILAATLTANCNAMAPLARSGPVIYCSSPGVHPKPGSFMFSAGASSFDQARVDMRYFRLRGLTKIALLTSSDASGQDAARGIKAALAEPENKDMTLVEEEHFNPGDVSVSAQTERIKAAKPQALVAWTAGTPLGIVLKNLADAGVDLPVATSDANMTFEQMNQYAPFMPKELLFGTQPWVKDISMLHLSPAAVASHNEFYSIFKGSAPPDKGSTLCWDYMKIVIQALNALPADASAEQLRAKIAATRDYEGLFGKYDFVSSPQRGLKLENLVMTRWNPQTHQWDVVSQSGGVPLGHTPSGQ